MLLYQYNVSIARDWLNRECVVPDCPPSVTMPILLRRLFHHNRNTILLLLLALFRPRPAAPQTAASAGAGFVGPDTYREGYSGGKINANLVNWKPQADAVHYKTNQPVEPQVTIVESSRFKYPTRQDPVQSETVNLAPFLIDGNLNTKWWSAIDEMQAWVEIDLGNPALRIGDEESRNFFLWKYEDQIEAGKDLPWLDGGLIGFHIDQVVIRWSEMYASSDYKIQSSIDQIQWKDRAVKLAMPNVYDRVDYIQGWSAQGVGNTRWMRITMVERVYAKTAWGMRTDADRGTGSDVDAGAGGRRRSLLQFITREEQGQIGTNRDEATNTERTVYGIREIEVIGPEPSVAGRRRTAAGILAVLLCSVAVAFT